MSAYRCPLGRYIPTGPDVEAEKTEGWREHGILVVNLEDARLSVIERQALTSVGNRLYGRRRVVIDGR